MLKHGVIARKFARVYGDGKSIITNIQIQKYDNDIYMQDIDFWDPSTGRESLTNAKN